MSDVASRGTEPIVDDRPVAGLPPSPAQPGGVFRTKIVPGLALALVVGLLGLLAYSLFAPEDGRTTDGVRLAGSGWLVYENPDVAPDFTIETFDGGQFSLAEQQGKIVVMNFWASWCGPCENEMPLLVTANSALPDDVVMVGVNVEDERPAAEDFLTRYEAEYVNGIDATNVVSIDYGRTGVPETFVIDAEGRLVAKLTGELTSVERLQEMIEEARSS